MLIAVAGPSTVGKDSTWVRLAETLGFSREVPFTSRKRRPSEIEGKDYHFVSDENFKQMINRGQMTAWDHVLGHYYGTGLSLGERVRAGDDVVLQVLARMGLRLKEELKDVRTVLLHTSDTRTLRNRLIDRGYSGDELDERVLHAEGEMSYSSRFDIVIPDADIVTEDEALRYLQEIVSSR